MENILNLSLYENHPNLREIHKALFVGRTWRYLRYLHAREALNITHDVNNVLIIGAGNGIAELGLAIEFPNIQFILSDFEGATHSTEKLRSLINKFKVTNISFRTIDITDESLFNEQFDLVYSVEVLEHIQKDELAALNMSRLSSKYIFCLVPFAQEELNQNKSRRQSALERHGHYVVGYDEKRLSILFPGVTQIIRGCYWRDGGLILRNYLSSIEKFTFDDTLLRSLHSMAFKDVRYEIPKDMNEAQGIWILSKVQK